MGLTGRDLSSRVSEGQDIIDTRDIVERIKELEDERQELVSAIDAKQEELEEAKRSGVSEDTVGDIESSIEDAKASLSDWDDGDEAEELKALQQVREDYCGGEDFEFGETLIADHYFVEYAEQLAEDIGAIQRGSTWPNNCIDWKEAARQLQQDYNSLDYGSTTYWFRS